MGNDDSETCLQYFADLMSKTIWTEFELSKSIYLPRNKNSMDILCIIREPKVPKRGYIGYTCK